MAIIQVKYTCTFVPIVWGKRRMLEDFRAWFGFSDY